MSSLRRDALRAVGVGRDNRFGEGYLIGRLRESTGASSTELWEVLWALLADGLLFIDRRGQSAPENWHWVVSRRGRAALQDEDYVPHDPEGFLTELSDRNEGMDDLVLTYAREALHAFNAQCYLASSVMVGVASERALLLLMEAFASTLEGAERQKFDEVLNHPRRGIYFKFDEFRKRLEPRKPELPEWIRDSLALHLDAVADLLRVARNDSGHPTGRHLDGGTAYVNLRMFGRYTEKLWALRSHFLKPAQ